MSVIFFEGFNYSNSDLLKLNPDFWTVNDPTKLTFGAGRTNNEVILENRSTDSGLEANTVLTLQNFTDPLASNSGFAIGFGMGENNIVHRSTSFSSAPYLENFVKFYDNSNIEVLSIDVIRTSGVYGDSLGFAIYQNNTLVDVYDLKSHIGHSWTITNQFSATLFRLSQASYIDIYIDPVNNNHISINFSANVTNNAQLRNTSDQYYTSISGFNSLGKIEFYSKSRVLEGVIGSLPMRIDDFYIKTGNTREEAVIGNSVKIYKLVFDNNTDQNDWASYNNQNSQYFYLNSNDGDASYVLSSNSGDVGLYNLSNLPGDSPSGVAGVKISNIVRSSDIDTDWQMVNVLSSGDGIIEDSNVYTVDSTIYSHKETFLFQNPITSGNWTKNDIDNLRVGIKNLAKIIL